MTLLIATILSLTLQGDAGAHASQSPPETKDFSVSAAVTNIIPPRLVKRTIAPNKELEGGPASRQFALKDGDVPFTLFLPGPITSEKFRLTVHFHTAAWFVIQEHVRREAKHPLVSFQLGEGSTVYRRPFEDRDRFDRCLRAVEARLRTHTGIANLAISDLELSSFSAGYGAIREIVKSPAYRDRINAIVLADSIYAGFQTNGARTPDHEHIDPWIPFAQAARDGKKTFLITYSEVATANYASSSECAQAIVNNLGLSHLAVSARSLDATKDPEFPLRRRTDVRGLHVWGYGGTNAQAHLTHARHLAELWQALQGEKQP